MTHTWDYANGASGYYPDNVIFTAPFAGTANISGSLKIDPGDAGPNPIFGRPQEWYLLINGVQMGSGVLGDADPSQILSQIETFDFPNVSLSAGEPVELEMIAEGLGTFIDISMTVDYAVPEPSTLVLFGRSTDRPWRNAAADAGKPSKTTKAADNLGRGTSCEELSAAFGATEVSLQLTTQCARAVLV